MYELWFHLQDRSKSWPYTRINQIQIKFNKMQLGKSQWINCQQNPTEKKSHKSWRSFLYGRCLGLQMSSLVFTLKMSISAPHFDHMILVQTCLVQVCPTYTYFEHERRQVGITKVNYQPSVTKARIKYTVITAQLRTQMWQFSSDKPILKCGKSHVMRNLQRRTLTDEMCM